jgi:hypothetical protein
VKENVSTLFSTYNTGRAGDVSIIGIAIPGVCAKIVAANRLSARMMSPISEEEGTFHEQR